MIRPSGSPASAIWSLSGTGTSRAAPAPSFRTVAASSNYRRSPTPPQPTIDGRYPACRAVTCCTAHHHRGPLNCTDRRDILCVRCSARHVRSILWLQFRSPSLYQRPADPLVDVGDGLGYVSDDPCRGCTLRREALDVWRDGVPLPRAAPGLALQPDGLASHYTMLRLSHQQARTRCVDESTAFRSVCGCVSRSVTVEVTYLSRVHASSASLPVPRRSPPGAPGGTSDPSPVAPLLSCVACTTRRSLIRARRSPYRMCPDHAGVLAAGPTSCTSLCMTADHSVSHTTPSRSVFANRRTSLNADLSSGDNFVGALASIRLRDLAPPVLARWAVGSRDFACRSGVLTYPSQVKRRPVYRGACTYPYIISALRRRATMWYVKHYGSVHS